MRLKLLKKYFIIGVCVLMSMFLVACGRDAEDEELVGGSMDELFYTVSIELDEIKDVAIDNRSYGLFDVYDEYGEKTHYVTSDGNIKVSDGTYIFNPWSSNYDNIGLTKGKIIPISNTEFKFCDESGKVFYAEYTETYTDAEIIIKTDTITLRFYDWSC